MGVWESNCPNLYSWTFIFALLPKTGLNALNTVIQCNYNDGHLVLYPVSIKFIVIRKSSVGKLHWPEF